MQERFKRILKKYSKTQKEVAETLGITTQALGSRIRYNPTYDSLVEISKAIGCELCELIDDSKKIQLIINDQLYIFYSSEELKTFLDIQEKK